MITPQYCQMMARYNAWQNHNMRAACETLTDEDRRADRGAFFGSVMATINHILWGDSLWMSRLDGGAGPKVAASEHAEICESFAQWIAERDAMDQRILHWSNMVTEAQLQGDLHWHAQMLNRDMRKPTGLCVVHMFNHQTHHRGQVHALLTGFGKTPEDTDLVLMPEEAPWL